MTPHRWLGSLVLVAACHGGSPAPPVQSPEPGPVAPAPAPAPAPPDTPAASDPDASCRSPAVPKLASYQDVRVPDTYWLDMVAGAGGWQPAEQLPMPLHHATRLELTNPGDFPALATFIAVPLRFTVELTDRDIEHDEGRHTWFVTYRARILAVCPAGAP